MLQARPVGVPSLYYLAAGEVGRAVSKGRCRCRLPLFGRASSATVAPQPAAVCSRVNVVVCVRAVTGHWKVAAAWLMKASLGGEEASVAEFDNPEVHGNGSAEGWGCWAEGDGAGRIAVEEIGSQSTFRVGEVTDKCKGAYGAAGSRKLFVDVIADSKLGPSKVCCGIALQSVCPSRF